MSSPWALGNTTVRNPLRIRRGLIALYDSPLNGFLIGSTQEMKFADLLEHAGVVEIKDRSRDYSDLGRKWRSCFSQLGFITHKFNRQTSLGETEETILKAKKFLQHNELRGLPFEVTPSGKRLIGAESLPQQQECMLRALLAYEIPSIIEPSNGSKPFKPLFFMLRILSDLLLQTNIGLAPTEMAILQTYRTHSEDEIKNAIDHIRAFRTQYESTVGSTSKAALERKVIGDALIIKGMKVKPETLKDYVDSNFRYLKYTGLFSYKGKRFVFNAEKRPIIEAILHDGPDLFLNSNDCSYLVRLWNGAELPTDNEAQAISEMNRYRNLLSAKGLPPTDIPLSTPQASVADINQTRLQLEEMYQQQLELQYASEQSNPQNLAEIIAYLKRLNNQKIDMSAIEPIDDKAAYLEWVIWRAFLALDSLINPAYEARRFQIDQDFFPIGCAPGRGPDMIFIFSDFALVVEVTLTSSSRQEAAEGEPVRRHVALEKIRIAQKYDKPVYGLFLAGSIDNNTAETFRIGVWYNGDTPEFINIVPLTLSQFILIFEAFQSKPFGVSYLRRLLDACLIPRNAHAPAWKTEIMKCVQDFVLNVNTCT